jgi:hypothetical protein
VREPLAVSDAGARVLPFDEYPEHLRVA